MLHAKALGRLCAVTLVLYAATLAPAAAQPAGSAAPDPVTTIIVVRHAEKMDDGADPALSAAGEARAAALAGALQHAGVTAIYTTQFRRTRDTAVPLARRIGVTPTLMEAGGGAGSHASAVAERVLAEARGSTAVIVGHSNTVPDIVRALGGPDVGAIADDEYMHLFVLLVGP